MNLILLFAGDYVADNTVCLRGRRLQHVLEIHRAELGDCLRVGDLNGAIGEGRITALSNDHLEMQVSCCQPPPEPLDIVLVLALPRPKVLKRTLLTATTMGVKQIVLLNSWRVDKSYWGSPALEPERINEQLYLGLEQCCDTRLPTVTCYRRFKPFVEDVLPSLMNARRGVVAHPVSATRCPEHPAGSLLLAVGPEGGFIPYEVEKFQEQGLEPVSMGARILRVETAVTSLLTRLG